MNYWLKLSIEYANQRSYLDDLYRVYPSAPEGMRDIDDDIWNDVVASFNRDSNDALIENLLKLELFPIKDPYVAYLRKDKSALARNPETVNRLCGRLYELGIEEIYRRASQPKEPNRQMGPHFGNWLRKRSLGVRPVKIDDFLSTNQNAVLDESDARMQEFARRHLNYKRDKGLDLVARFGGNYVIAETKFLTEVGGHQTTQFNDAIELLKQEELSAIPIAILDGILYISGKSKMYRQVTGEFKNNNIMSSLVLREFLYHL